MRLLLCSLLSALCWAQAEKCAIEGQVFNNATGEPLKKVQILLVGLGSSADAPLGALTDTSGRFTITDIPPGRFALTAERAGFIRVAYSGPGTGRRVGALNLSAGQHLKDIVFRMTPQGVVSGRVLDEDGDPVAGVQVQAMRNGYAQGRRTLLPAGSAATNDIGEYRLAGLPPGKYYITASYGAVASMSRGNPEEGYAPTYYPGTADPAAAAPVQIFPGSQMRGVDISLTRTRTVRVSGRVANPGAAVGSSRSVMVFLMPRDGGMRGFNTRNSTMAKDGRFEIRGVLPGSYLIAAHWYDDGKRSIASQPVEVGADGLDNIALTMAPGFEVPGQVKVDGSRETNFRGTQVLLVPANEMAFGGALGGRVQEDGSFVLTNASPDHYRVQVAGMPEGCYLKSARLGENDMLENGATLTAGAGPLDITLSAEGGQVEGAALDAAQQPAAGATVVLVPDERRRQRIDLFRTAPSDQNGRFSINGIAPGDYKLYAWQEVEQGAWQDPEFLKQYEKGAESVSIEEKTRLAVQLKLLPGEAQ